MKYKIPQNEKIIKFMSDLDLYSTYSSVPLKHIEDFLRASVQAEFSGKVVEMAYHSDYHRTTIAHFLNKGRFDESKLENKMKSVIETAILNKSQNTGLPVFFSRPVDYP